MGRWTKTSRELGEHAIFGDEEFAALQADLEQLTQVVAELSGQLHAQFTTIAAHAEIAREQSEFARDEARSDLERTRSTLIELIEQARGHQSSYPPPMVKGGTAGGSSKRIDSIERRIDALASSVEDMSQRQRELTEMMAAMLDTVVANDSPLAPLSLA